MRTLKMRAIVHACTKKFWEACQSTNADAGIKQGTLKMRAIVHACIKKSLGKHARAQMLMQVLSRDGSYAGLGGPKREKT